MAATPSDAPRSWSRDRFYTIGGCQLLSVTTILFGLAAYNLIRIRNLTGRPLEIRTPRDADGVMGTLVAAVWRRSGAPVHSNNGGATLSSPFFHGLLVAFQAEVPIERTCVLQESADACQASPQQEVFIERTVVGNR
jgi:hypothetical protein